MLHVKVYVLSCFCYAVCGHVITESAFEIVMLLLMEANSLFE